MGFFGIANRASNDLRAERDHSLQMKTHANVARLPHAPTGISRVLKFRRVADVT
jgi:hypothetical protein